MLIKLLNKDLIRRFGKSIIDVDSGIGNNLINKKLAIEIQNKQIVKPEEDKMIKENEVLNKSIFPKSIIDDGGIK